MEGGVKELTKDNILHDEHWTSDVYKQRMITSHWKALLLNNDDHIIYKGKITQLTGRSLGCGVFEVKKKGQ